MMTEKTSNKLDQNIFFSILEAAKNQTKQPKKIKYSSIKEVISQLILL